MTTSVDWVKTRFVMVIMSFGYGPKMVELYPTMTRLVLLTRHDSRPMFTVLAAGKAATISLTFTIFGVVYV